MAGRAGKARVRKAGKVDGFRYLNRCGREYELRKGSTCKHDFVLLEC